MFYAYALNHISEYVAFVETLGGSLEGALKWSPPGGELDKIGEADWQWETHFAREQGMIGRGPCLANI